MRPVIAVLTLLAALIPALSHTASAHRINVAQDEQLLRHATLIVDHGGNALTWLRRQPSVRRAALGRDHQTISIHLRDGLTEAILPRRVTNTALPDRTALQAQARAYSQGGGAPALVMAPFEWEYGAAATNTQVYELLQSAGFQTTEALDNGVTVALMKTLADYKVVYITGHSGWLDDGTIVISTGQATPASGGPYANDLGTGNMILGSVAGGNGAIIYYDITPRFITTYLGHFMSNSIMLAMGCGTIFANDGSPDSASMWQALQQQGLSTYVGWNDEVMPADMERAGYNFFVDTVSKGMTAGAAIQDLLATGVGTSSWDGKPSRIELAGDPTLQVNPTITPPSQTGAPPTSTPMPPVATATTAPPPTTAATTQPTAATAPTVAATSAPPPGPPPPPPPLPQATTESTHATVNPTATVVIRPTTIPVVHAISAQVSPTRLKVGVTTTVTVRVVARGFHLGVVHITLNGHAAKAGVHKRQANTRGMARFHEHPRKPGTIVGYIRGPGLKTVTFRLRATK